MKKKVDYPAVKKALYEAWRAFIPAFLTVVYIQFEAGVDLKDWKNWLPSLLVSAFFAGMKAVVKWVREKYGNKDYSSWIYKLPI